MKCRRIHLWAALMVCAAVAGLAACGSKPTSRGAANPQSANRSRGQRLAASIPRLPLVFEKNEGQADPRVEFLTRGAGYQLFLTGKGATWALARTRASDQAPIADMLRMHLVGGNTGARVTGIGQHTGKMHYFRGSEPVGWHTNVPTFARVRYAGVYPGIDLVYYGREGELAFDFVVAPGADPAAIALEFSGARELAIDAAGDLVIATPAGRLVQRRPLVYQNIAGARQVVESKYVLTDNDQVGFALGPYDYAETLVIDPVLVYSTYLGGTGGPYGDQAYGVAVDQSDNIYITGKTASAMFPAAGGQPVANDAFVVKMTAAGALAYVAVIGGNASDSGEGIAVDGNGNVIITGFTDSTDFPTLNPIRSDQPGRDGFLAKLDGFGLVVYSTYLGGNSSFDYGEAVAVDADGNAYAVGATQSTDFPVLNALQPVRQSQDAFVVKVDPHGNQLYGTYLGGSGAEAAESVAVDSTGSFYVTGWSASTNFPRVNSSQVKQSGDDVFVSQYAPDGSSFVYSRYLGGNSHERAYAITLDGDGGVYVGGRTDSTNFPSVLPLQADQPGTDAFLTRLDANGVVSFSTYLGGDGWERILGLSVRDGYLYATGQTFSTNFPSLNAVQPAKAGTATTADAFMLSLDLAASALAYSTYLGGSSNEEGRGVASLAGRNAFVAGWTESTDFPTVRAIQDTKSNIGNLFISRIAPVGVDAVSPGFVIAAGGDAVTITGAEFVAGATVLLGNAPATSVSVIDPATITAVVPPLSPGVVDLTVTNPDGGSGTLYGALMIVAGDGPLANAGPDQVVEASGPSGAPVVLDGTASFDPNGDPLTFEWNDESNHILGTSAVVTPVIPLGVHSITLTVSDGQSAPAVDTISVAVVDTTPPAVTVVSPNGGNKIYTGTPTILEWTASDGASGLGSFDVYLSTDAGVTYGATPICAGVSGSLRSCTWTSPTPVTSKARIRVTARDAAGNSASDSSNANFTIASGTAWVKVTSPNTNVNWAAGSTQQIKWSNNLSIAAYVRLEASYDGGVTWSLIAAAVKNSSSSSGVYNWTLPATLSSTARIRVSWNNGPVSDQSDTNFTIANAFIALTSPTATTNWGYGTTRTQTWTTNLGPGDFVDVLVSTDGGATFPTQLAANKVASAKTANFTVPTLGAATTAARTRVSWTNAQPGFAAQGTSPANFRIEPAFVTVSSPNGGETWTVGSNRAMAWSHNLGSLENLLIELSQDDGTSYPIVLAASTPSDGSHTVMVDPSWVTTLGRLRLTWVRSPAVADASNASFVIQ